jgi:hypothetical protein
MIHQKLVIANHIGTTEIVSNDNKLKYAVVDQPGSKSTL